MRQLEAAVRLEPEHPIAAFQLGVVRFRLLDGGVGQDDLRGKLELRRTAVKIFPTKQYHWQQLGMEILKGLNVVGHKQVEDPLTPLAPGPPHYRRGACERVALLEEALAALDTAHKLCVNPPGQFIATGDAEADAKADRKSTRLNSSHT